MQGMGTALLWKGRLGVWTFLARFVEGNAGAQLSRRLDRGLISLVLQQDFVLCFRR